MPQADTADRGLIARLRTTVRSGATPRALLGSLLLHALVGIGLWHLDWTPSVAFAPQPRSAIALRAVPNVPAPRAPPEPAPQPELLPQPEPEPERELEPEPAPEALQEPEPASAPQPLADDPASRADPAPQRGESVAEDADPAAAAEDPVLAEQRSENSPSQSQSQSEPTDLRLTQDIPEEARLEAARREAVAAVLATLREEADRRRFSTEGIPGFADDEQPAEPGAGVNIFEEAQRLARSRGVGTPGRARSRIVRNLVSLCNELTGGFSIFGIANFCADPGARADLFGHLRPQYMQRVPLCTADEDLQIVVSQSGTGAIGELRCVLVTREEREAAYGRYDPDLAGWLPAEAQPPNEAP